jgi:hypothetical protein
VAESVDAADSKSVAGNGVPVRVWPGAPTYCRNSDWYLYQYGATYRDRTVIFFDRDLARETGRCSRSKLSNGLARKPKKGFRGFPMATVAFYGPGNKRALDYRHFVADLRLAAASLT